MDNGQSTAEGHLLEPVSSLAERIVGRRLERVVRLFPKAAKHPERDVEYVHGLRVAIRRATAALQMFSSCLPRSEYREVRSQLRRIRRAAGPARDLDVLEERLSRLAIAGGATVQLGSAIDQVRRRRKKAGKPLLRIYKKTRKRDFKGLVRSLPKQVAWRGDGPEPVLIDWAGSELRPSINGFVARSTANLTDPKALHRMRVAEKRMRYSLELLGGAVNSPVDQVAPVLSELQERLGGISDHEAARVLLLRWRDRSKDDGLREVFAHLAAFEKWQGSYVHDEFLKWWTPSRRLELSGQLEDVLREFGESSSSGASLPGAWIALRPYN